MTEEILPDNLSEENENEQQSEGGEHQHRQRRRVRKRIRIKKKASPKKKLKKYGERLLWIVAIGGFILALIYMVKELNVVDEKEKNRKAKSAPTMNTHPVPPSTTHKPVFYNT